MSFPRAKLQRFNEIPSCTPSPADYNPLQKTRTGSVISTTTEKFEKFSDNGSVISNDSSCFRTPTLIRKKKTVSSTTKLFTTTDREMLQEKIVECNNKDAYIKDLIEQIEDLKMQIAELNKQKIDLESEKGSYEKGLNDIKEKQKSEMDNLVSVHKNTLDSLKSTLRQRSLEFSTLKEQYSHMKEEHKRTLTELLKNINELGETFNVKMTQVYDEEIKSREDKLKEKELEIARINENLMIIERKNSEEVEKLTEQHQKEISDIDLEMLSTITKIEKKLDEQKKAHELRLSEIENLKNLEINELKNEHSNKIASLINEKEIEIKRLEEEYNAIKEQVEKEAKEHMEEIECDWKNKLKDQEKEASEILKNYQRESEAKVIEIELEKNKLKQELSDLKQELENLKDEENLADKCEQLQMSYNQEIADLKTRCAQLELQKTSLEHELKTEYIGISHTYQITLQKTREAVDALSKRLLDSNHDVEKLKEDLEVYEAKKLNLEAECNKYQEKIEILTKANTELEERQDKAITVYKTELNAVKEELENKTVNYKNLIDEATKQNEEQLQQKRLQLNELRQQLDLQQSRNVEAQDLIKNANNKISILEDTNLNMKEELDKLSKELEEKTRKVRILSAEKLKLEDQLEKEMINNRKLRQKLSDIPHKDLDKLMSELLALQEKCESSQQYSEYYKSKVEEYEKEIEDTKKIHRNYNEQCKKYEELMRRFQTVQEQKIKLEKTVEEYESLIGPYREQLEAFESERKLLLSQKSHAEVEAARTSAKYAEILGHQNQKQKIKHMIDLKEKNAELATANKCLETKIRSQVKTIEKLKKELNAQAKTPKKLNVTDKENVNTSYDYLSPLRDRN